MFIQCIKGNGWVMILVDDIQGIVNKIIVLGDFEDFEDEPDMHCASCLSMVFKSFIGNLLKGWVVLNVKVSNSRSMMRLLMRWVKILNITEESGKVLIRIKEWSMIIKIEMSLTLQMKYFPNGTVKCGTCALHFSLVTYATHPGKMSLNI